MTCEIIGTSRWTRSIHDEITRVAPHASSILITGPSGTGKELVARAIHDRSGRRKRAFVPVDCASLTGSLLASQLFGHLAGSFTNATHSTLGCFRSADGGTIFLDEVGELELDMQAKLLRVLQERVVIPVGSHESIPVDVRVVAATNRDLKYEVVHERFREDLYFRLGVVGVQTIPLCERPDDIPTLAEHILDKLAKDNGFPHRTLSVGALQSLTTFSWPGNVRQLNNVLEQAVILSESSVITTVLIDDILQRAILPEKTRLHTVAGATSEVAYAFSQSSDRERHLDNRYTTICSTTACDGPPSAAPDWTPLADVERDHIRSTLEHTYYNQSAAARLLRISRQALIRKMKRYEICMPSRGPK